MLGETIVCIIYFHCCRRVEITHFLIPEKGLFSMIFGASDWSEPLKVIHQFLLNINKNQKNQVFLKHLTGGVRYMLQLYCTYTFMMHLLIPEGDICLFTLCEATVSLQSVAGHFHRMNTSRGSTLAHVLFTGCFLSPCCPFV